MEPKVTGVLEDEFPGFCQDPSDFVRICCRTNLFVPNVPFQFG